MNCSFLKNTLVIETILSFQLSLQGILKNGFLFLLCANLAALMGGILIPITLETPISLDLLILSYIIVMIWCIVILISNKIFQLLNFSTFLLIDSTKFITTILIIFFVCCMFFSIYNLIAKGGLMKHGSTNNEVCSACSGHGFRRYRHF